MDQRLESHSEKSYKFYESLGSPKYICIRKTVLNVRCSYGWTKWTSI